MKRNYKQTSSPISIKNLQLIFDLHGVLICKPKMSKKYDEFVVNFLIENFNIDEEDAIKSTSKASKEWLDFWIKNNEKKGKHLIKTYEKANSQWAKTLLLNRNFYDYQQLADFLEYYVPTHFCSLYEEVNETLISLKNSQIDMSLASTAHSRHIFGVLVGCQILNYFKEIIGFDIVRSLKSNIWFYQQTIRILKTSPENCIFIGNSKNEIKYPKKLGAKVVAISREIEHTDLMLSNEKLKPDLILPTIKNLKEMLLENKLVKY